MKCIACFLKCCFLSFSSFSRHLGCISMHFLYYLNSYVKKKKSVCQIVTAMLLRNKFSAESGACLPSVLSWCSLPSQPSCAYFFCFLEGLAHSSLSSSTFYCHCTPDFLIGSQILQINLISQLEPSETSMSLHFPGSLYPFLG